MVLGPRTPRTWRASRERPTTLGMPRRPADSGRVRVSDKILLAWPREYLGLGVEVDRTGADYRVGAAARRAGRPRDGRQPLAWLVGWDEGAPA